MGKSNRIRVNRANEAIKAPTVKKTKKKKGMPGWALTLITVVLTVILLASVALSLLLANGVPNRLSTSMKSENFRINVNMMSYFLNSNYQSFLTNYEDSLSNFSLNPELPLRDQMVGGDPADTSAQYYDIYITGNFEGTWFDYFVDLTKQQVANMLIYLEEANARGITLTEEEKDDIRASLDQTSSSVAMYYSSLNAYLSDVYGKGVNKSDVLKAMEYSALADKTMLAVNDDLQAQISDEEINTTYAADKKSFDVMDYSYYTFKVDYDDIAEKTLGSNYKAELENNTENQDKVLTAYKAAIEKAKADADALIKLTDTEAFKKAMISHAVTDAYDDVYTSEQAANEEGALANADQAAVKEAIQKGIIAEVIAKTLGEVPEGQTEQITISEDETTGKAYGYDVSGAYAEALQAVRTSLESKASTALTTYILDKATYTQDDTFSEWAFGEGIAAGSTKIETEGDGAEGEITNQTGYSYVSAYLIRTAPRADDMLTRSAAFALFSSEDAAKAAIEALKVAGSSDADSFLALMNEKDATSADKLADCYEGASQSDVFDAWLFDGQLTVGKYTEAPLKLDDSSYCVAYYYADGQPQWKVTVTNSILNDDFNAYYEDMEVKYVITTKDNSFKKIDA